MIYDNEDLINEEEIVYNDKPYIPMKPKTLVNYWLDENGKISLFREIPFNINEPFIEVNNLSDIKSGYSEVRNGELFNPPNVDELIKKDLEKRLNPPLTYEQLVQKYISERYSLADEIAILRQKDIKPNEYLEYFNFIEECKAKAKKEI